MSSAATQNAAHHLPAQRPLSALGRYFEVSLYLLLLDAVFTLVSTGKLDIVTAVLAPAALLFKGYRWWHGCKPELPTKLATWLVAGYLLFYPVDFLWVSRALAADAQNPVLYAGLLSAVHLLLFAMIVRLYSATATRDYLFLALLAFGSMLASAILTVGTAFLGFFLIFLGLGISTFIGLEMRRGAEDAVSPAIESGTPPAHKLHKALSVTSGAIGVGALLVGAMIFFILPRFNAGYLSGFNLQPTLISGFTDDVELGEIGRIMLSSAVVMRIKVNGGPLSNKNVRWRGVALTTFDGRRWFTEGRDSSALSEGADGWTTLHPILPKNPQYLSALHYTVYLEPIASDAIFVASEPARVRGELVNATPGMRRSFLVVDKTGSIANPFHNFNDVSYEVVSAVSQVPPDVLRKAPTDYSQPFRDLYLQLPRIDPRIPALAKQITANARTPYDQARAIESYLRTHYGYSLDLTASASDPLTHFLFERRAGHCEYFAAAMTVMLRTLGVPARYVNGFLPGQYNDVGGDYIVRAHDAHSWVEVFFPGYGWITFDPTPSGDEVAPGFLSRFSLYLDWFNLQWSEWIINYDFLHQYTLALGAQRASRDWTAWIRSEFERARRAGVDAMGSAQSKLAATPPWIFILVMIVIAAPLLLWRNPAIRERVTAALRLPRGPQALAPDAAAIFYVRTLHLLERRGWNKPASQTPLEFASTLPAGELGDAVSELTETYQSARFGGRTADAKHIATLMTRLETALRAAPVQIH